MQCMTRNGMHFGSHGYNHYWMNNIPPVKQEHEIDMSLEFLKKVGMSTDNWIMCYPYGAYNSSLIEILKKKNCRFALTAPSVKQDIAILDEHNAYSLGRLDTNDLPKAANAEVNNWTKKVLN